MDKPENYSPPLRFCGGGGLKTIDDIIGTGSPYIDMYHYVKFEANRPSDFNSTSETKTANFTSVFDDFAASAKLACPWTWCAAQAMRSKA